MRPRAAFIAAPVLALGFGAGLYASDHVGSEDTASTAQSAPAQSAPAPAPVPAETVARADTVEVPEANIEERPPVFAVAPLPRSARATLRARRFWQPGCPVSLSGLRMLTVTYRGFDRRAHTGELVVNAGAAFPLKRVFRRLYRIRFPIRHLDFEDTYGPPRNRPRDSDLTGSFECRQSVPSPCTGGRRSGHWSMHAYGLAVDLNPRENPYVGCGMSRDPTARSYRDRSRHRRGMVGPRVIAAFRSIGWGWGGAWAGNTKDYMHFSATGH